MFTSKEFEDFAASTGFKLINSSPYYAQANGQAEALFTSQKVLQNFSDSPSHRIFRRMHGVLNIDKNKN